MSSYHYTADYVTLHETNWRNYLAQYAGKPKVKILEIGSYEGRSAVWFLENILTHESSNLTCVDLAFGEVFYNNLSKFADKITLMAGNSMAVLRDRQFLNPVYDIIYIDGDHGAIAVLSDVMLSFTSLKIGGILIFDDYQWEEPGGYGDKSVELSAEEKSRLEPKVAIDSFINVFADNFDMLYKDYQVIIRKRKPKD
jgi:predicted O-methyltransferase YrrM